MKTLVLSRIPAYLPTTMKAALFAVASMALFAVNSLMATEPPSKFTGTPAQALKEVKSYASGEVPNGCVFEALIFADWFMSREIDGPNSAAEPIDLIVNEGKPDAFGHMAVLFRLGGKFYSWDTNFGVCELSPTKDQRTSSVALKRLAAVAITKKFSDLKRAQAENSYFPAPARIFPPKGVAVEEWVAERMNLTRPVFVVQCKTSDGGTKSVVGVNYNGVCWLYDSNPSASGGVFGVFAVQSSEQILNAVHTGLAKRYGPVADVRFDKISAPRT